MMHSTQARRSLFCVALLLALASLGVTRAAHASSNYPPLLKAALDAQDKTINHCVSLCTACHETSKGGPGMMNPFGSFLKTKGLLQGSPATVATAITALYTQFPTDDADMDGKPDIVEIHDGDSPSIAYPGGVAQFCPDILYGCGAHVAEAKPVDRFSLFSAGLVVFGLAAARRRRHKQRASAARR